MELRAYQKRIVREAVESGNIAVVLPTGAGKTLIAAETITEVGTPALFLVPTCLLVDQQAKAIRQWTKLRVGEYMGGVALPSEFDVLVSTPKAFQVAQAQGKHSLSWTTFSVVIFDEVHHVLKDHPYRKLAMGLKKVREGAPRILGLTASLTYAVGQQQVEKAIGQLCDDLRIVKMSTASTEEMQAEGYHGTHAKADVAPVDLARLVPFMPEGVVPSAERKPHLMAQTFFGRLRDGTATPVALRVHACIQAMEVAVMQVLPRFQSPLHKAVKEWGSYAHSFGTQNEFCADLEHWYEALRILAVSWEEAADAAVTFLRMNGLEHQRAVWPAAVLAEIDQFWQNVPPTFPRFENLKDVLLHKHDTLIGFRGLLFVQQRVMTHILEYVIHSDNQLSHIFKTACLYATSAPATPSLAVPRRLAEERLRQFASGDVNLLISTVVAEEGMDVPASNCVIRFDPMINSVSLVQGRGRARQEHSSFVVMSERQDRPVALLERVEKQQLDIVRNFVPQAATDSDERTRKAQMSRELTAKTVLEPEVSLNSALAVLNLYCKKTKVELAETYRNSGSGFECELMYESVLRSLSAQGTFKDKKGSKRAAALQLVQALQQVCLRT
eukprot:TRINITY_DN17149_c0_g1_i1.p1 TRINITY_DN17149_c0_g1~~TRINITY_DN17149_c0_g1_i1.p1  ORF type:complete len:612 (-),score=105.13 TRINITY_DN17149_c0_g1_i1:22-1857(-)